MTVDEKILDGAKRALKQGIAGWESRMEAANFFGISSYSVTDERIELLKSKGLSVSIKPSFSEKKEAVEKKLLDGIEKALELGIAGWNTKKDAANFFGITSARLTVERIELLVSKGLSVSRAPTFSEKKEAVEKKLLDGVEKALESGITGWESRVEAAKFFGVSPLSLNDERRGFLKSKGIEVNLGPRPTEKIESTTKKLLDGIEKALELGITGWENRVEAAKFLGVYSKFLTDERIELLKSKGLSVSIGLSIEEKRKAINKKILDGIKRALKLGITGWESREKAAKFFDVSGVTLTNERIEFLKTKGLFVSSGSANAAMKEKTDKKVLDGAKRALKQGIVGWESKMEAAKFLDIPDSILNNERIKLLESRGLTVSIKPTFVERKDALDEKIMDGINRALKQDVAGWKSKSEAAKFFGISNIGLNRERIAKIKSRGLEIREKVSISPNTTYVIRKSEEIGMRIDSAQALMELSLDFYSREVRVNDDILFAIRSIASVVEGFDKYEAKDLIGAAAWGLIEDGVDDFSMLELKLELFRKKVYFAENKIEACLDELDVDTSELHKNTMKKRFRLAEKAVKYGLVKVNYVDTLPAINNCRNRNIYVHQSIRKKTSFIKHWRQYAEIMMRNDIGGSVSRSPLPENLKIDEEINKNSSRAKAYLVDSENIDHLEKLGYEGISALILYGSRNAKNSMPRALQSFAARLMGFLLYLSQNGLSVPHSRFLVYTGGEVVSQIAEYFTRNHVVTKATPGFMRSTTSKSSNKFPLLSYKFASGVRHDADLMNLSFEEINAYVESVEGENVSGTLKLDSFCLKFLQYLGNTNAFKKKAEFSVDVRWAEELLNSEVSPDALKWYKGLIEELIEVTVSRHENEKVSEEYVKLYIRAIILLFEFLSIFSHKLSRKEMTEVLNPIIKSETKQSFAEWTRDRGQEKSYVSYQAAYTVLFGRIKDETYLDIYRKAWIQGRNDSNERALVRNGLELPVLVTYQDAILMEPFGDERYPFLRSTPKGEMIDVSSWWEYDFSPIPVICAWLVSKLPRRGKHIRFLDVNKFLVFGSDGTLKGLFFNTDKNKNADTQKDMLIPKSLLVYAFSDAELQLLINYTKYIQQAYSDRAPVKYSSNLYSGIVPLFPHHNKHDVISEHVLRGYTTKVMIKTQIIVRHNAKNGVYDAYYSPSALEAKREYLSTIDLVASRGKHKVPESMEELNDITVNQCNTHYSLDQGVHNFRHAISTALAHMGLSIFRVRVFTGHRNIDTLGDVYIHGEEDVISLIRTTTSDFFDDIRRPADAGNEFIRKICMPLVKSKDPSLILETLKKHGFMSLPRAVKKAPEGIHIDSREDGVVANGVEIASRFNPATWISKSFGLCPVGEGCPEESRGVCSLCPFLIFNASFVKGILLELNDAMNELAVFNAKNVESIRSSSGDEVQKQVAQKISEVTAWNDMFSRVEAQLMGEDVDLEDEKGMSLEAVKAISKNLFGFRQLSIDESNMEILYEAMVLGLNDVRFDRKAKEVAWKMAMKCAKNKDFATLEQLEKKGLSQFILEFGRMNFDEKKAFVLEKMGDPQIISNSPLTQQENIPLLEPIE